MEAFLKSYAEAAYTTVGFFWMAMWAFILGYFISSLIQVFVTEDRMKKVMGNDDAKSIGLGTFFGFISSSCSFSALATTKALFRKGAGFISSIAFLLASTNLVIELGIVISIFMGWQFVAAEYAGGILLILFSWLLITIIKPRDLIKSARKRLGEERSMEHSGHMSWDEKLFSKEAWTKVGMQYMMEWKMVWKDVTIGFTVAGIIAAFVPDSFFETLFINTGGETNSFGIVSLLEHVIVAPVVAFMTFIGSMGNIPLAALLYGKGVSFAGIMAFIFSDLVVFPVLRINAKYYGWKMSLFILFLLFASLIATSLILHLGFDWLGILPNGANGENILHQEYFKTNYTLFLNIGFVLVSGWLLYMSRIRKKDHHHHKEMAPKSKTLETVLQWLACISYIWVIGGLVVRYFIFM